MQHVRAPWPSIASQQKSSKIHGAASLTIPLFPVCLFPCVQSKPTVRVADFTNPDLKPWANATMRRANENALAGIAGPRFAPWRGCPAYPRCGAHDPGGATPGDILGRRQARHRRNLDHQRC